MTLNNSTSMGRDEVTDCFRTVIQIVSKIILLTKLREGGSN